MIDFKNDSIFKLKATKGFLNQDMVLPLFVNGEQFIGEYQAVRDFIVFTDKRIIAVNVQGITGKKKEFSSLPYSKIQAFSVETSGTFDLDSELELYFSGLGKVKFEFSGKNNVIAIGRIISDKIL